MSRKISRVLAVLVLLGGLATSLAGCDGFDLADLWELAALFLPEVTSYKVLGTTGDASIDALFRARDVFNNVDAADALMAEGRENGDTDAMEQAIEKRPHDWNYRVEAATLYLQQGDPKDEESLLRAQEHLAQAREDMPDDPEAVQEYSIAVIESYEDYKAKGDANGYASASQCEMVHDELIGNYRRNWALSGNEGESPRAAELQREKQNCGG